METKAYQLILSPDLDLSPSEVVTAWNAGMQASTIASVHLVPSEAKQFDPTHCHIGEYSWCGHSHQRNL